MEAKMVKSVRALGINVPYVDIFPKPNISTAAPTSSDTNFELGQLWVNTSNGLIYGLSSVVAGSATWSLMAPGASDVDTLTGDIGGAIAPAGGNITLAGGTNIGTSGAGSTITFNLDAAISLATSVTSPIYTVAAATDLNINAVAGKDIIIKMGDAVGANKVSFVDSASVEVAAIDSSGGFSMGAITFTGLLTANASATILTAGTALNLGSDNSGDAVNLGVGTVARAIGIGSSAAAHTVTVGSVTGAASLALRVGTGNFTLEGATGSTYSISATGANTGTITISGGTGAQTTNISTGGTGVKTVNVGTGAIGNIITIGTVTDAASLDLKCGTGNFTLEGNVASTYSISATGANTGTVTIGAGTGARIVNLATGGTGVKTVNIGTGAIGNIITIGTVTDAASLALLCGTGNFTLEGATGSTYSISATGANTGTVTIGAGTGARIVNLGTGGTGIKTVNIATGAIDNIVTIGTVSGAASLSLLCGTGNFSLEGNVASTYAISGTGANTGTITIGGGSGAQTLNMMNSTGGKTINIASGAGANAVTVGSTNSTSSLILQAGSGEITVTGTVKEINAEFLEASGSEISAFSQSPILTTAANTAGAATGANGDVNLMYLQQAVLMEQFIIGTQTIIGPRMDGNGLLISLDLTVAEGAEYNFGAARTNSRHAFTIGTSPAFFFEVGLRINDMDGAAPYIIGFRKAEANNAVFGDYTDYAAIGMIAATTAVNVITVNEINAAGQTITNTTDAWGGDGTTNTLRILVSAAGVVTYTINGSAPSVAGAVTFDNADVVCPFIHLVHSASATAVNITSLKCGFQA
jgi:hypothetical protein